MTPRCPFHDCLRLLRSGLAPALIVALAAMPAAGEETPTDESAEIGDATDPAADPPDADDEASEEPEVPAPAVTTPTPDEDPLPDDVTPEELEAIERALELDLDDDEPPPPVRAPTPARPAPPGALAATMNPDLALIANLSFAAFSGEPRQTGAHDPREPGFNFQQLEASFSSAVDPYFRFDAFIVFGLFGVEVEEAYATTLALPWSLQARVGQFLTRVGRINPTHPHEWLFEDQPLVLGKLFGGENNRGLGVELSWLSPLPWYLEVVWSMNDGRGAATARSFWGADRLAVQSPLDFQHLLAVRQFFDLSPDWGLMVGVTGLNGPNPTGPNNRTDIWAADVYLRWRPITAARDWQHVVFQAEYFLRRRQVPGDLLVDHGGYAHAAWRFALRWETGLRTELVTGATGDPLDPEWTRTRRRHSAVLTFRPTEFSRLRLQASRDEAPFFDRPTHALFLAAEFGIGAHAAHPF